MEISKELLSEILTNKKIQFKIIEIFKPMVIYQWLQELEPITGDLINQWNEDEINIYELADKAIDWIESQGYYIINKEVNIYRLYTIDNEVYSIDTKTRIDIPFMCAQWIIDNIK